MHNLILGELVPSNVSTVVYSTKLLTDWVSLVWVEVFMHVHGKVHHVGVAEQVQLALQHVLFIVQLEKKQITNNDSMSK